MEMRTNALLFPKTRNSGPIGASTQLRFARDVLRAVAAISSYSATFENRDDHHLGKLDLSLTTRIDAGDARNVIVEGLFSLRDWSGTWDDAYSGSVAITVLAELVAATPPAPGDARGDLVITDAEITQGIQHFRSALHLDSANVFPDNSIRLVEGKPTGVRVWVDYDRNSGLPLVASLSGSLLVQDSAGGTTTLLPVNSITPKRESQISRGMASDTLNFVMPDGLCSGDVTITAQVFSRIDPTSFSTTFQKSLSFEALVPVRVFAVGVNYTGPDTVAGEPTSAPAPADFVSLFGVTELLYPIPQVTQTGYMTIDYNGAMNSDISKGCDKMGDFRDDVADLRGDSTDIFYALLNSGVETGSVGGCGGSGGAGVGIIGGQGTVAHELGHILGRRHVACDNVTRCARPLNTDGSYPVYPGYDSDSIGEFGFNTTSGAVLSPGNAHDMMGYSGNAWIGPYTYKALMTRIPAEDGGAAGAGAAFAARSAKPHRPIEIRERIPRQAQHLFVNFVVQRDRSVAWRTAFHFLTGPQSVYGDATRFVLELRDGDGQTLIAHSLHQDDATCGCAGDNCIWPKTFKAGLPYDPAARRLVVLECEKVLLDVAIPEPPKVELKCDGADDPDSDFIACHWQADPRLDQKALWYLLQWRDRRGVWRGVAARTQRTGWAVPKSLWGRTSSAALRVLASSGIATSVTGWEGMLAKKLGRGKDGPRKVHIGLADVTATGKGSIELPPILRLALTTDDGARTAAGEIGWYGASGGLLGRGKSLLLSTLAVGTHQIRVAVENTGDGSGDASWIIEHTRDGRFVWHRGTITYPDPECRHDDVTSSYEPRERS